MTPKKMFFTLIGVLVLAAGVTGAGFYFARGQLKSKAAELSKLKAELDVLDVRIADAQTAIAQYEDLKFIDNVAADVLPPAKIQSNLVGELYALASNSSVTIRSLSFQSANGQQVTDPALTQTTPLDGVPGVFVLPVDIAYSSPAYDDIVGFLRRLEDNRRKLQISRASITPIVEQIEGSAQTAVIGYEGSLQANVYIRP